MPDTDSDTRKHHGPGPTPRGAPGEDRESKRVRVDPGGRVVVPAEFRKALGIRNGQEVLMALDDGFVRLQTIDAALERVRVVARRRRMGATSVVDDFIAGRRAEATKE